MVQNSQERGNGHKTEGAMRISDQAGMKRMEAEFMQ